MESQAFSGNFSEANVDALAVVVFKDEKASGDALKQLDGLTGGHISAVLKSEEFKGESGETSLLRITPQGKVKASRLLLVGAGDRSEYKASDVSIAAGAAVRYLRKCNAKSVAFDPRFEGDASEAAQNAVLGAVTSQ